VATIDVALVDYDLFCIVQDIAPTTCLVIRRVVEEAIAWKRWWRSSMGK